MLCLEFRLRAMSPPPLLRGVGKPMYLGFGATDLNA